MECRAEFNRFAVFLFCLLVPLGSTAPTESKASIERFTTEISTLASVIEQKAHELFEFYKKCIAATFYPKFWEGPSEGKNMSDSIPHCPAFQANCCALHRIRDALQGLREDMENICTESSRNVVTANINQLSTTLRQGTAFYTCSSQLHPQGQPLGLADKKVYIWWVLKKYKDIMQRAEEQQR